MVPRRRRSGRRAVRSVKVGIIAAYRTCGSIYCVAATFSTRPVSRKIPLVMTIEPNNLNSETDDLSMDDARTFAVAVARIASDHKTEDVAVLDLRGLCSFADYFVIGTGTSERQMHAVLDHIHDFAEAVQRRPFKIADTREASWVLADYADVIIHLFDAQHREYYDLDGFWGDAALVDWATGNGEAGNGAPGSGSAPESDADDAGISTIDD
jgi:ribosome-associated protein